MTAPNQGYVDFSVSFAEKNCDHLLDMAGLKPRWKPGPGELPDNILQLGAKVLDNAYLGHLVDANRDSLEDFGRIVSGHASTLFAGSQEGNFRAARAKMSGIGNCIAAHEGVSGVLSVCGLGEYAVSAWRTVDTEYGLIQHASSGLLIADLPVRIDGYNDETTLEPPGGALHEIYKEVINNGTAVLYDKLVPSGAVTRETIDIAELHTVDLSTAPESRTIVMSAADLILMLSSGAVMRSPQPRHAQAQNLLGPFAPKFKKSDV